VIGTVENVQSFTREQLFAYKNKFYYPQNTVIALAGNLPDDYVDQIASYFAYHQGEVPDEQQEKPSFTPNIRVKQKPTEQSHICMGMPGLKMGDDRIYHMILLNNILGGNMSSRLFQEVREERGLAYSVYSYHSAYRDAGLFAIYAGTAHGQEEEVLLIVDRILQDISKNGVKPSELNKAKEQLKGSMMLGLESTNNRMSRLGRNELLLGHHLTLDEILEKIEQITLEEVNQLASEIFTSERSLAIISPSGTIPSMFRRNAS
jgi:predicted Zn-dependent peptidase